MELAMQDLILAIGVPRQALTLLPPPQPLALWVDQLVQNQLHSPLLLDPDSEL